MSKRHSERTPWLAAAVALWVAFGGIGTSLPVAAAPPGDPVRLPDSLRVRGGLIVVVGDADVRDVLRIARENSVVLHWLAPHPAVGPAREALLGERLYGKAVVEEWTGPGLPYAGRLVSALVVVDPRLVTPEERRRVVRPGGELLTRGDSGWTSEINPAPAGMDEWTHWRHAPDRNPVSKDRLVEVPRRIQWLSLQGKEGKDMVSAGGRCFYALGGVLAARDAFNGIPLWTRKADPKCSPIAVGETVWAVTERRLVALDAATGKERRAYPEAASPQSLALLEDPRDAGGALLVADDRRVALLSSGSGRVFWELALTTPRAISAAAGRIFLIEGDLQAAPESRILAIDQGAGTVSWERRDLPWARFCFRSCTSNGTVAFETGRFAAPKNLLLVPKAEPTALHFVSAADGKTLRDVAYTPAMRHDENVRVFFVGDRIAFHRMERDRNASSLVVYRGLDREPEIFPALPPSKEYFYCYPPTATERFFIYGQLSFTDWETRAHVANPITRGSCGAWSEGVIPANGMIYVFPKSCNCFTMLSGLGALAPADPAAPAGAPALEKGPAYGAFSPSRPGDWTGYRGDEFRSGSSPAAVPADAAPLWSTEFPPPAPGALLQDEWKEYPFSAGTLTPPVVAEGLVVVAQPHAHRVVALDEATGKVRWTFVANGRVDTPPTVHEGLCLFGTRAGWIYALRASDGALAWRLRAAPAERRIAHFGQVESPWPAPGSVLVSGGTAYFGIGIHPLADGGVRAFAVDPRTGAVKWTKALAGMGYDDKGWHGRAGLEQDGFDLMVRDGDKVALSRWVLDPSTGAQEFLWQNAYYRVGTDGAYMQRGTWSYGYPMNRPRMRRPLLVARGAAVFGANRVRESGQMMLFRRDFKPGEPFLVTWSEQPNDTASRMGMYFPANRIAEKTTWSAPYPGWIEAMVMAGETLFLYADKKLRVYDAADGRLLRLSDVERPVWDGFAAAHGRLYVSTLDGRVVCLGKR
jgi:outer membrane protein assembly factor BamB